MSAIKELLKKNLKIKDEPISSSTLCYQGDVDRLISISKKLEEIYYAWVTKQSVHAKKNL